MNGGYGRMNGMKQLGAGWGTQQYPIQTMPQMDSSWLGVPSSSMLPAVPGAVAEAPSLLEQFRDAPLLPWSNKDPKTGVVTTGSGSLMPGIQLATGAFNAWMGMKNYGLAKKQFAENKHQFGLNYDAQRTTTNSQLEDRQRARVASNASAYQSVGEYMSQNSIKPRG